MTNRSEITVHQAGAGELNRFRTLHFELIGVINNLHDMEDKEAIRQPALPVPGYWNRNEGRWVFRVSNEVTAAQSLRTR